MSDRKARVSLCMIVRDEESNLAECLAPVAELFDEIVIVDTGSQDKTKEVARAFTPHVHEFEWCDDFSAARNECLRYATSDWIFWLDADDRLGSCDVARLRKLLDEELTEQPRVFMMDTVLVPAEAHGEPWLVTHPRLFRRMLELQWEGRVHEQLRPDFSSLGYEQVFSDVQIAHLGYQGSVLHGRKARRNIRLLRMDYAVDPNNPSTLLQLGLALCPTNRREAKQHLLRLVKLNLGWAPYLRRAYYTLAELLLLERSPREAADFAQQGLDLFPDDEQLLFVQALAWQRLGDYARIVENLKQILDNPPVRQFQFAAFANLRNKLVPRLLGSVLLLQKEYGEAEAILLELVRQFPTDIVSWYDLGWVYLDSLQMEKFAEVVRELLKLPNGSINAGLLTAVWALRHGDPSPLGPIIDQLVAEAPRMPHPRILRCAWLARCGATLEEQSRAIRDVLRIEPTNTLAPRWLEAVQRAQAFEAGTIPVAAVAERPAGGTLFSSAVFMAGVEVGYP